MNLLQHISIRVWGENGAWFEDDLDKRVVLVKFKLECFQTIQPLIATSPMALEHIPSWLCCADKAIRPPGGQNKKHMSDFLPEMYQSSLIGRITAGKNGRIDLLELYPITRICVNRGIKTTKTKACLDVFGYVFARL